MKGKWKEFLRMMRTKGRLFPHEYYQRIVLFILMGVLLYFGALLHVAEFSWVGIPVIILGFIVLIYICLITAIEDEEKKKESDSSSNRNKNK